MTTRTEPTPQQATLRVSPDDPVIVETEAGEFFAMTLPCEAGSAHLEHMERADLIVRAVNSHAALVEALEESNAALHYLSKYALPLAGFRLADGLLSRNKAALDAAKGTK